MRPLLGDEDRPEPVEPAELLLTGKFPLYLFVLAVDDGARTLLEILLSNQSAGMEVDRGKGVANALKMGLCDLSPL